ncbi:ABC transporter permease [Lysobacter claricitrinus]|uniref:ABC transporter permease n=1 Tax=Lysobacter claricitrinus TaxID=3367728 RepID=UPI0037DB8F78
MKYLHLIWASLFRSRTRTLLTLLSVFVAFFLFGMLDSVRVAFNSGGDVTGANRMVVASRLSITQMLPYRLDPQIASIPGVRKSSFAAWFGGIYQDPKNFFPNFSVGDKYLDLYPEFQMPPAQRKAWESDRQGAIVGETLAKKFGWKVGDMIPLQATIFPTKGSNDWQFKLDGIFHIEDVKRKGQEQILLFHWNYFDEANDYVKGRVGWYIIQVDNAGVSNRVAKSIDALSANSDHETKTQTEEAFNQSFAKQIGDIGLIVTAIMGAVFFTLLLLTGNTMAQAVRERIPELAVLKTIGFQDRAVLGLVLFESIFLVAIGAVLGLVFAPLAMQVVSRGSGGFIALPDRLPPESWATGLVLMVLFGVLAGLLPALRAMRLNIVDALAGR